MRAALDGLRVVDVSSTLPGTQVTQLLADFGAEVIQAEPPGGSPLRAEAAYPFWARGKKSIELDLHDPEDHRVARNLIASSDVLVEAFRPGVAERLGLGYDELSADNPRLVHTSITGFGRTGPYAGSKGYEALVMARLGAFTAFGPVTARPGPTFISTNYASFSAAQTALHGTLAALFERERSGRGQHVETSLVQGIAAHGPWNWFVHLLAQRYPDALTAAPPFDDEGIPTASLYFRLIVCLTADGRWLQFSQTMPHLFRAFMESLGLGWMLEDPDWATAPEFEDRAKRVEFWDRMVEAAREKTLAEWQRVFDQNHDVWAEVFRHGSELLDHPQLVHDGQVVETVDPERGRLRQPGPLVRLEATPADITRPAPGRDEHGVELREEATQGATTATAVTTDVSAPTHTLPLGGVLVLELGTFYAAPYGATLLADLGARVVKVEPLAGDPMRSILPFPEAGAIKVLQGKDSVAIDIDTDAGREIVYELARRSDIVLQSYRAGVARRLHVDAESLLAVNPDLVYLNSPGYGIDGPCGDRPAFAPTIGAGTGMGWRNSGGSIPERADLTLEEIKAHSVRLSSTCNVEAVQADGLSALAVATAMLLGLLARERGSGGQSMLTTMLTTGAHVLADEVVEYEGRTPIPHPDEDQYGLGPLYRLYETADGWVFLAAPADDEWPRLLTGLGGDAGLDDERFETAPSRVQHADALADALAKVFGTRAAGDWERDLMAAGIGCVVVPDVRPEAVLMSDELGRASGFVADVEHPTLGNHPRLAPLVSFSRSATVAKPGCLLGAHTDAVLRELGYDDAGIARLRDAGVVIG